MPGRSCWRRSMALSLKSRWRVEAQIASISLQEIRSDVGFLPDRVVIAKHAVGHKRVGRNDGVPVRLDRIQTDYGGMGPAIPFEWSRAWRLFAGRHGFGEHIAFDERLDRPQLGEDFPVEVEGCL